MFDFEGDVCNQGASAYMSHGCSLRPPSKASDTVHYNSQTAKCMPKGKSHDRDFEIVSFLFRNNYHLKKKSWISK